MNQNLSITVVGAGGKMGCRIVDNLVKHDCKLHFCETGAAGIKNLEERGLKVTETKDALAVSDYIILALPDALLGKISHVLVPMLTPGTTVITLDPAAAYAGELCTRDDCTFVVTHPCHPPLFGEQESDEARRDVFGGIAAKQDIVISFMSGEFNKFEIAEQICINMFAPVVTCHRITVEQMALLEPAAAEVVIASAVCLMKEALDEAIKRGVPEAAATSFLLGHIQVPLAIVFKSTNPFSDAAKIAVQYGTEKIYKENWKEIFEPENVKEVLTRMLHPNK
ncbi:MAG TPA: phosphogluconate dehydrogenase C-terminal domain-containing protein [Clostridia bacterium]|nr:phosphogluconate dehydrogenase C-terminal domain-containing protein [Clostridia bacterium]